MRDSAHERRGARRYKRVENQNRRDTEDRAMSGYHPTDVDASRDRSLLLRDVIAL